MQKEYVVLFGGWAFNCSPCSIFSMCPFKTSLCWTLCFDLPVLILIDCVQLF